MRWGFTDLNRDDRIIASSQFPSKQLHTVAGKHEHQHDQQHWYLQRDSKAECRQKCMSPWQPWLELSSWYPIFLIKVNETSSQWRHNGHDSISNHQPHDCFLNRLIRRRSKKKSKLHVTGLCEMASYAENVSIWWRHHVIMKSLDAQSSYELQWLGLKIGHQHSISAMATRTICLLGFQPLWTEWIRKHMMTFIIIPHTDTTIYWNSTASKTHTSAY